MAQTFTGRKRVRKFFGKIQEVAEMPNLIEVQKASYDQFLLVKEPVGGRPDEGLQAVFRSVFPISDFSEKLANALATCECLRHLSFTSSNRGDRHDSPESRNPSRLSGQASWYATCQL